MKMSLYSLTREGRKMRDSGVSVFPPSTPASSGARAVACSAASQFKIRTLSPSERTAVGGRPSRAPRKPYRLLQGLLRTTS